ncbi:Tfp pilus assembly protein FimT/FimU [Roseateles sp. DC23W]|uniref:Type II secretion system protein H n=1 Tax=Pelomonas dachongensis TaxID=3299029 RepID=A0ABW7ETB9_9BURK
MNPATSPAPADRRATSQAPRVISRTGRVRSRAAGQGFTLIEVGIVMAVMAILAAVAIPSYMEHVARQRLRLVAEQLEQDLRRARALSVNEGRNISVSFRSGAQWCWGTSRQGPCDCAAEQSRCELAGMSWRNSKGVLLQSGQGITFEGGLGRALGWSRIGLSNERNQQLSIDLNPLGRPQICGVDARKGSC